MDNIEKYKDIQNKLLDVYTKKNADYGSNNLDTFGKVGIMVRIQDKLNRYINVSNNGINMVNDEALNDTIEDLINYCYLLLIIVFIFELLL